jgi:hypothetical protein
LLGHARSRYLGGDLLVDAEVSFDCGDPFQRVVYLFAVPQDIFNFFAKVIELRADAVQFTADGAQLLFVPRQVFVYRIKAFIVIIEADVDAFEFVEHQTAKAFEIGLRHRRAV